MFSPIAQHFRKIVYIQNSEREVNKYQSFENQLCELVNTQMQNGNVRRKKEGKFNKATGMGRFKDQKLKTINQDFKEKEQKSSKYQKSSSKKNNKKNAFHKFKQHFIM